MDKRQEQIEQAKRLIAAGISEELVEVLHQQFPELKESEEERIRKALLRCCDDWDKGQFGCMAKEDVPAIRAYLEKQKEQQPIENIEFEKEIKNWSFGLAGHDAEDWAGPTARYFFKLGQDSIKPAEWSEEDEKMRNALWNLLKIQYAQDNSMTGVGIEAGKFRDWLKSLRPQPHWKPSEYMLSLVKKVADGEMLTNMEQMAMGTLYNDLKKL